MEEANSLKYIYRKSSMAANAPLLIMLHGYGSDENDLFSFASELPEELFIISVRATHQMMPFGNCWYEIHFDAPQGKWSDTEQAIESRDKIAGLIDEVVNRFDLNAENVTLLGFSQGTILSLAVALTYPEKIKNVVGLSGYLNSDLIPEHLDPESLKHLSIYSSHGSVDQVIPVDWARQTKPALDSLAIDNVYKEFPVGHGVSPQNFFDFKSWLSERI